MVCPLSEDDILSRIFELVDAIRTCSFYSIHELELHYLRNHLGFLYLKQQCDHVLLKHLSNVCIPF